MKNKYSKLLGAAGITGAAFTGISYLTFREVMYRDAAIPPLIAKMTEKIMTKDKNSSIAEPDKRAEWFNTLNFEEFSIINDRGLRLKAYLLKAECKSNVYVFCSHGYHNCGKGEFNYITKYHHDRGRNVILVDHQASGESEGKYIGFGYHEYRDCLKWLTYFNCILGEDIQFILHGISMGSATVMMMCGDKNLPSNVKFAIADCGYTSAEKEFEYLLKNAHVAPYPLLWGADFFNKQINGFHFSDISPLKSVEHSLVPILFIHGKTDDFVPTAMVNELYNACNAKYKDLLIVDDAWHAESYRKDSAAYEAKVDSFAEKFISK